jgi:xanthine dehydrogenase accessory factor
VCGGKVLVYIEPNMLEPRLVILGAGHVGRALTTLARFTGFHVTVVDDRAEFANRENVPDADDLIACDFERAFDRVPAGKDAFVVIATRGHNHDLDAVKAALRTDAEYIGLLGSRRKKALLHKALAGTGFSQEDIERVIIPVGTEIGSVTPEEIAVSIMAQVIEKRRQNGATRLGHTACSRLFHEDGADKAASPAR